MVEILNTLREIETDVIQRSPSNNEPHIGSIKFLGTKGKRMDSKAVTNGGGPVRPANRRIPSFGMGVHVRKSVPSQSTDSDYSSNGALSPPGRTGPLRPDTHPRVSFEDPSEDEEDEELEAILALNGVEIPEEPPRPSPNANSSEMSWRLTGWMQEYVDKILPKASQSQISTQQNGACAGASALFSAMLKYPRY